MTLLAQSKRICDNKEDNNAREQEAIRREHERERNNDYTAASEERAKMMKEINETKREAKDNKDAANRAKGEIVEIRVSLYDREKERDNFERDLNEARQHILDLSSSTGVPCSHTKGLMDKQLLHNRDILAAKEKTDEEIKKRLDIQHKLSVTEGE